MMYLVRTENKIIECSSWSEVNQALLEACSNWVNDKNYVPTETLKTAEDIFNTGINEQDFGDVAQVFRICAEDDDGAFYFNCCSPQDTFIMTRIL